MYFFPGLGGGVLGALLLFSFILAFPADGLALIGYGVDLNYQQMDTTNGQVSTSTTQEKFSFYFNLSSRPASRLSVDGILRFDVLQNSLDPGSESTEIQPNAELRLATSAVQLGVGYRRILRNENIISGASAKTLTSDSSDAYIDATIRAGKLPTFRVRYSLRDQKQEDGGSAIINTSTKDLQTALNYRLGIFTVNADYRIQNDKDKISGRTADQMQFAGQLALAQKLGTKMDLGLRENYTYNQIVTDNVTTGKQYTSISEGRFVYNPFLGANINTNYIYRIADDMLSGTITEKTWFTAVNYALPKYLRFYGSYLTLDSSSKDTVNQNQAGVAGLNFVNTFGRFAVASRYERRWDINTSTTSASSTKTEKTRDNFDWVVSSRLAPFLNLALSESYVADDSEIGKNQDNRFRLKADIGPLRNLAMNPYLDYDINTPATGQGITTTQLVFPIGYRISLHRKLELNMADTYQWTMTDAGTGSSSTQTNNAILRLLLASPLPGTAFSGDATFTTSSASTGQTTSTSAYSVRGTWVKGPHSVNANLRFQTGTNAADTASMAFLYGLGLRMKKLTFAFQARYDYSIIFSSPQSTAQTIYFMMSLRK